MAELSQAGARGEGDTDSGINDTDKIIGIIQEEIKKLATDLKNDIGYTDKVASEAAEKILLMGEDLQPNSGITDAITKVTDAILNKIQQYRKKIPSFLLISAPTYPQGSRMRKNVEKQRECEAKNFTKLYGMDSDKYRTIKVVDSYAQMLDEIKEFVKDKKRSELPFVVFLGHGTPIGQLCFHQGPYIGCQQALKGVHECFKENKREEMPSWQLRVVFAQCYGHRIDRNDVPGKIQACEIEDSSIEYTYITSKDQKTSHSAVRPVIPVISHRK